MAGEFERIRWMTGLLGKEASPGFSIGPGDDAASWTPPRGHAAVMTVDVQLEGVHLFGFDAAPCSQRVGFALAEKASCAGKNYLSLRTSRQI